MTVYATPDPYGGTELRVADWDGWVRVGLNTFGYYTIALRRPGYYTSFTGMAGHPDVVRSVAETMLRGAARADGIEVRA